MSIRHETCPLLDNHCLHSVASCGTMADMACPGDGSLSKLKKKTCREISEALQRKEWRMAESKLVELTEHARSQAHECPAKLGSLQRWVRDADTARDSDETISLRLLYLLCRLAAGEPPGEVPKEVRVERCEVWHPKVMDDSSPLVDEAGAAAGKVATHFRVAHRESALLRQPPNRYDLRLWASTQGATSLDPTDASISRVSRVEVETVPGAFVLNDVLTAAECSELLGLAQCLGFEADEPLDETQRQELEWTMASHHGGFAALAAEPPPALTRLVSKAKSKQFGERSKTVIWLADEATNRAVFKRCEQHLPQSYPDCFDAKGRHRGPGKLCGLNARWRFYQYQQGGVYRPHVDGAWPGSALDKRGRYVYDAFGDRLSKLTAVVYLNQNFEGGATAFYSATDDSLKVVGVQPTTGSVLFFPHGDARGSLIHEGSSVISGSKYIIRTEVLYSYSDLPSVSRCGRNSVTPERVSKLHSRSREGHVAAAFEPRAGSLGIQTNGKCAALQNYSSSDARPSTTGHCRRKRRRK